MLGLVDLQPGNYPICDARIIIDKSHGAHDPAHAKCSGQLITGHACTVNRNLGQTVIATGKEYVLSPREPVAHEVLTHAQAQTADDDEA
jgi:hypothetical protein